jgi:hypothetical protein
VSAVRRIDDSRCGLRGCSDSRSAQRFKVSHFTTHLTEATPFVQEDYLFSAGDETFRFLLTRYLLSDRVIGQFYLAPGHFDPFRGYMAAGTCSQATTSPDLRDATADEALAPHRAVDPGQMGLGEMPIATTWNCEVVDETARRHTGVVVFGAGREPSARLTFGDGAVGQVLEAGSRLFLTYRYTGNHINTFSALTDARAGRQLYFLGMPMIGWLSIAPGPAWSRGRADRAGPLAGRCAYVPARSANGIQRREGQ